MPPRALLRLRAWPLAVPFVVLTGLPILVALPQLLFIQKADPLLRAGWIALRAKGAVIGGLSTPVLDGNDAYTNQALGHLAALDWVHFAAPWWNPYSGVGLPLAAEYQPAAFFPLVFLQLLPNAMILQHVALQIIAGWGAYALLRQLGLSRLAATCAGVLFAFNGVLSWFNHAPALPVPFLPWTLLAIERIHTGLHDGWPLFALALALALLAGFPETAYLNGLLALAWAGLRLAQTRLARWPGFVGRLALGLAVALAIAAPQLLSFAEFLPLADVGAHAGGLANAHLPGLSFVLSLVAPYAFGPPGFFFVDWPFSITIDGSIGGYVALPVIALAIIGLRSRAGALGWMLAVWILLCLGKTFGIAPIAQAWNLIPGIGATAFARYAPASWELALIVLAAYGLDAIPFRRPAWIPASVLCAILLAGAIGLGLAQLPLHLTALRTWFALSLAWTAAITALCLFLARRGKTLGVALLLAGDAVLLGVIPTLSYPTRTKLDEPAISFLRERIGLHRFYTLGPIRPNYGAYFRIASINHNYLPVARRWADWVRAHLDRAADPVVFVGGVTARPGGPSPAEELKRNLANYEWLGVKYVLAPTWAQPDLGDAAAKVFSDQVLTIFELPNPASYFQVVSGACGLRPEGPAPSRTNLVARCATPATLVRRELFFPGWSASINGHAQTIRPYGGLFQSVTLPPGENTIRFAYAPPHILWGWLVMGLGIATLGASSASGTGRFQRHLSRVRERSAAAKRQPGEGEEWVKSSAGQY